MQFTTLTVTAERHIGTVTLNRPDVRNAFNETVIAELTGAFRALGDTPDVRAIVLTGNGPAFCAGADLNWMKKMAGYSDEENRADALTLAQMLHTIWVCPKPVIARAGRHLRGRHGPGGRVRYRRGGAWRQLRLSEARLGLLPATISPYVIRAMGEQAARRYFITAERFDAAEALRLGFVHAVVAPQELDERVAEIAATLVNNSPNAVRESKRLVQEVAGRAIDSGLLADTANRIAAIRASDEGREGVRSFLEKRPPSWKVSA